MENDWALQAVIRSLTLVGDKRAVPILVELTKRKDPIPLYAARALLFFDDREAQEAARRVYQDESQRAELMKKAKELGPAEFLRH